MSKLDIAEAPRSSLQVEGSVTETLAMRLRGMSWDTIPFNTRTVAKQCLLDWLGVTIAARNEPLVRILMAELVSPAGSGCSLIGHGERAPADIAVLINGSQSHALDFDDVIVPMGHPTVPVAPVVMALAEERGATGAEALTAFICGVEAECRVARLMGPSHYQQGWHSTGTFGTFGAMAAAARLLNLDSAAWLHAFGLAGTQAAGLKSVFGSMSKPLHAGKAAQNGLLAARLASRGFTSDTDILGSEQGFAATQSSTPSAEAGLADLAEPCVTDALFKYHAACYLTHNTIEAANQLRAEHALIPDDIAAVTVRVSPAHLGVCNILDPNTGLECKFSLRMTAALALSGENTFDEALFSDETAQRGDLVALRQRITVEASETGPASIIEVMLKDGRSLSRSVDVSKPVRDLQFQQNMIERKFRQLATQSLGEIHTDDVVEICRNLELQKSLKPLLELCRM